MKCLRRVRRSHIFLALIIAAVPVLAVITFRANADNTFDIVGWHDASGFDAVTSVKVYGKDIPEYETSMYESVPDYDTVKAPASGTVNVEITLKDGYTLGSDKAGSMLYLSGVQSQTAHVTSGRTKTSIKVPAAAWRGHDKEFFLEFSTKRKPKTERSGITTIKSVELNVEKTDCAVTINGDRDPAPVISVPAGKGYVIDTESICWVKKEGASYNENACPFVAKGLNTAIFRVDLSDKGSYVFSDKLNKGNITINNGRLLDCELLTIGGYDQETKSHKLCLTVCMDLNHVTGEPRIENKVLPTCTKKGHYNKVAYCERCKDDLVEEVIIPAKGHNWGSWKKLNSKQHQRVCKNDASHKEKAKHVWNKGKVTKKATKKKPGIKKYTCKVCKAIKKKKIKKKK